MKSLVNGRPLVCMDITNSEAYVVRPFRSIQQRARDRQVCGRQLGRETTEGHSTGRGRTVATGRIGHLKVVRFRRLTHLLNTDLDMGADLLSRQITRRKGIIFGKKEVQVVRPRLDPIDLKNGRRLLAQDKDLLTNIGAALGCDTLCCAHVIPHQIPAENQEDTCNHKRPALHNSLPRSTHTLSLSGQSDLHDGQALGGWRKQVLRACGTPTLGPSWPSHPITFHGRTPRKAVIPALVIAFELDATLGEQTASVRVGVRAFDRIILVWLAIPVSVSEAAKQLATRTRFWNYFLGQEYTVSCPAAWRWRIVNSFHVLWMRFSHAIAAIAAGM